MPEDATKKQKGSSAGTKTNDYSDYDCLSRALWYAEKNGYQTPALEKAMFDRAGAEPLQGALRRWAIGLIMDQEFAMYVFGENPVDENGASLVWLELWAKQTHYRIADRLYKIDRDRGKPSEFYQVRPGTTMYAEDWAKLLDDANKLAVQLIETERVEMQLEDRYASLAIDTHQIQEPRVGSTLLAWQYHLKEMAISDNPFLYLKEYIDSKTF